MSNILASTSGAEVATQVHSYVEHRAPDLHNAWANNSRTFFDHESGQYVSDVQVRTDRFKKVIALYTEKSNNSLVKNFDIRKAHTWEEVQDTAAQAVAAYNAKGKGFKGFLLRVGRKFSRASPAHQGWIQTLPNGDYGAIICGALTLVFGAAARMGEVRKKILEALDCIPDALDIPEAYLVMYRNDKTLARKAVELYMALLEAIEIMLDWLDHKAYKEVANVFAKQGYYGTDIEAKLEAIQAKSAAFTRQVEVCLNIRVAETHLLATINEVRGGAMFENMQATTEHVKENSTKLDSLTDVAKDNSEALNSLTDVAMDNSEALNSLTSMLKGQFSDLIKYAEWYAMRLAQDLTSKLAIQAAPRPFITADQLMTLLQVDPELATRDIVTSLRQGNLLKPPDQQRAAWLMNNSKFQSWFQSGFSEMLVVDGMGEMIPISPMSYFCSMLSQELCQITNAVPISFFCGIHARYNDNMSDATAMMRSLICQLLANPYIRQYHDLSFMTAAAIMGVQSLRLDYLCELFRRLICSLTSNTAVFVLIDGISWFETQPRRSDLWFAMQRLRDLAFECNTSGANRDIVLKLLLTSPKASMHVKHVFPRDKQLVIPSETLGNGQSFNSRQMAMQQQRLWGSASSTSSQGSSRMSWMDSSSDGTPSRLSPGVGQSYDFFGRRDSSQSSLGWRS